MKAKIFFLIVLFLTPAAFTGAYPDLSGKILFTNVRKSSAGLDKGDLNKTMDLTDDIYLKAILKKPLAETYDSLDMIYDYQNEDFSFNYALRFYINGEQVGRWIFEMPPDDFFEGREFDYVLSTSNKELKRRSGYTVNHWIDLISSLEDGKYEIKAEFIPANIFTINTEVPVLAEGSATLLVESEELEIFTKKKSTQLPEPTVIAENLEAGILRASEEVVLNKTPVRAIITDVKGDWSYGTDKLGNIIRRYIIATVLYRNIPRNDCEVRTGVYYQEHKGHGIFGKTFYLKPATGYYKYSLPCEIIPVE